MAWRYLQAADLAPAPVAVVAPEPRAKARTFTPETLAALLNDRMRGVHRAGQDYYSLLRYGLLENPAIFRAVEDIALGAASVPLDVYVGGQKAPDHPVAKLLRKPTLRGSGTGFMALVYADYALSRNAFIQISDGMSDGAPVSLKRLPAQDTTVERPDSRGVPYTLYRYGSTEWKVSDADELSPILHVRGLNPFAEEVGLSPLRPSRTAIDRHNLANEWNAQLLQNSAKPSGALTVKADQNGTASLTPEQRDVLKAELEEMFSGPENAGRPPVLEGGLDWVSMGLSPVDMDWTEAKASAARDAAVALGYPPMLLAIPGDNTFSNQREARLALWENTIIPMVQLFCQEMAAAFGARFPSQAIEIRPNLNNVPALAPKVERLWERIIGVDFLTVNEKREATGYAPRPEAEADEILVTVQSVPLHLAVNPPDEQPAPAGDTPSDPAADPTQPDGSVDQDAVNASSLALNGTQVTSLLAVLAEVTGGQLPKEVAKVVLVTAFAISPESAAAMIDPLEIKPRPEPTAGAPPASEKPAED